MVLSTEQIIAQTKNWVKEIVIGCGFCPFAHKVFMENSIRYVVIEGTSLHEHPMLVLSEMQLLEKDPTIETTLIVFSEAYQQFSAYLQLVKQTEKLSIRKGFEGVFQIASFHPEYIFGDAPEHEASHYTNRSPYPMLHLLREESLSKAISFHPNPEAIPQTNIDFTNEKGIEFMKQLLQKAMKI